MAMVSKIYACAALGIDGLLIDVETDISNGLPGFTIVGLPDMAVRESKERVRTSIKNSGFEYPLKKITVNLAPADIKKEGPIYDLPIAVGILYATGQISSDRLGSCILIGELSLDGRVKPVDGALCMVAEAAKMGFKSALVPYRNAREAAIIKGIDIYPVGSLGEAAGFLGGTLQIEPYIVDLNDMVNRNVSYDDFADIKGQESAKRALEIAAAGGHNVLMIGPPGSGKSMLAKRLPGILPDMTFEEAIEVTKIYSIAGKLSSENGIVGCRPFRSPHHTISPISLIGGGKMPKPGEVSLSHFGVLFLDELPEFQHRALEVLRQPMEDGWVNISRVNGNVTLPSVFMLVASMNPCQCGFLNDPTRECTCTPIAIKKYLGRISGPLLDRIDIHIEVYPVKYAELDSENTGESSEDIRKRVNHARSIQNERYRGRNVYCNSQLTPPMIKKYCSVDEECKKLLKSAFEKMGLSARAYGKVLKIARTVADIDGRENIGASDIAEALQYRRMDRKYWKR